MLHTYFLGILLVVGSGYALYDSHSDVVDLTPDNFDRLVTDSYEVWLVEFYAPWCGHCKNLVPEYKKAAKALRGIVKVGAIDADKYKSFGKNYGVSGFPTIKIFTGSKHVPFKGSRTADGLVDAALKAVKGKAYERLGKRPEESGSDKQTTPNTFGYNIPWKKAGNKSETSPPPTLGDQQLNDLLETCLPDFKTDVNQQQTTTKKIARMKEVLKTSVKKNTTTQASVKTTTTKPSVTTNTASASVKTTHMTIYNRFKMLQMQLFRGDIKAKEKAKIIKILMRLKYVLQNKGVVYANASIIKRRGSDKRQGRTH